MGSNTTAKNGGGVKDSARGRAFEGGLGGKKTKLESTPKIDYNPQDKFTYKVVICTALA